MDESVIPHCPRPPEPAAEIVMRETLMVDGRPITLSVTLSGMPEFSSALLNPVAPEDRLRIVKRFLDALADKEPRGPYHLATRQAEHEPVGGSGDRSLSAAADDQEAALLRDFDAIMARVRAGAAAERIAMDELATRLAAGIR